MITFESFLLSISWKEYVLIDSIAGVAYYLLRPFEWDYLRAPVSIGVFVLLVLIKFVTRIDYLQLAAYCITYAFIELWCSLCLAVFTFFLYYQLRVFKVLLYYSFVIGCITFFLLFFFKQMIGLYI